MTEAEWDHEFARCLGAYLVGATLTEADRQGHIVSDDNFLLLLNAHHEQIEFQLPAFTPDVTWDAMLDTDYDAGAGSREPIAGGTKYPLTGRSLVLLREIRPAS